MLIISYLEISDCMRLSLTSLTMMREILPVLNSRRNRINDRFGCVVNRLEIMPGTFMESKRLCNIENVKSEDLKSNVELLPTVREQVMQLSKLMPQKHTLYEYVTEMGEELNDVLNSEAVNHVPLNFSKIHFMMQKIMRPLKLYKHVISKVIYSSPLLTRIESSRVSLDQYIGDVLCITYLCHQSDATLVQIIEAILKRSNRLSTYISWVLLHSAILRRKKFSKMQLERLGIPDFDSSCSRETTLFPLESVINNRFMSSEMTMTIATLGSRGSQGTSFRLRDTVQVHGISAHCLYAYFNSIDVDEDQGYAQGAAAQMATEWLCRVHEEVRRFRPVVIEPPHMRLTCSLGFF